MLWRLIIFEGACFFTARRAFCIYIVNTVAKIKCFLKYSEESGSSGAEEDDDEVESGCSGSEEDDDEVVPATEDLIQGNKKSRKRRILSETDEDPDDLNSCGK